MDKKFDEKNDSALMSGLKSDIIDTSPMSYILDRDYARLPHKEMPQSSRKLIAICASTGGPKALSKLIPMLPEDINAPIIMVQHMPKGFTGSMAKSLDEKSKIRVYEAHNGNKLKVGCMYIAKGGEHLTVTGRRSGMYIKCSDAPARSGLKPCADIMFESLMKVDVDEIICVVLTGMGSDGTRGIGLLSEKKNIYCIAQDEGTSTVYGMPSMVKRAGLADEVLPLEKIADAIIRVTGTSLPMPGNGGT